MTEADYQAEYRRLLRELGKQFAVGDSPQEQLLVTLDAVEFKKHFGGGAHPRRRYESLLDHSFMSRAFSPQAAEAGGS